MFAKGCTEHTQNINFMMKGDSLYDVVCIGFGPAALSLAIALHEHPQKLRVLFLEKQPQFCWTGNRFPATTAPMRTNLLQDLVTQRNPKSHFTFINYLWSTENLVAYTNLTTHPPRELFAHYLKWCAHQFDKMGWVQYGHEAEDIRPVKGHNNVVRHWSIKIKNPTTSTSAPILANKVITATGTQAILPSFFSQVEFDGTVVHAKDFSQTLPRLQQRQGSPLNLAIAGENNEAVEIFEHCRSLHWNANVTLFANDCALRQTDKNPFIGDLVASPYAPFEHRELHTSRRTSIKQEELDALYLRQYAQLVKKPQKTSHQFQIRTFCEVIGATRDKTFSKIILELKNSSSGLTSNSEPFDIVFSASGYECGLQKALVEGIRELCDGREGKISVDDAYNVRFRRDVVAPGIGIWILDAFEDGTDDVFSYLGLKAERVVQSVMNQHRLKESEEKNTSAKDQTAERSLL